MGNSKKNTKSVSSWSKIQPRLFSDSPDVIVAVDKKHRVLFMNRAMDSRSPKKMLGRDSATLFPRGFRSWYRRSAESVFRQAEESHFQYSTDQSVWWEIRVAPIRQGRKVVQAMILCSDVTEKRTLHAKAIRHARLATIGVLAASVAHEINNPNSAVLFNASVVSRVWTASLPVLESYHGENGDFLLGDMSFSDARQAVSTLLTEITHNTRRVEHIVSNLKHLAKQDENEGIPSEKVEIHAILQASIMILNHKIRRHTDYFEFLPGKGIPMILGNSPQLEQVFINVILNALQSLPNREGRVQVSTAFDGDEKVVLVLVRDEGVGISPDNITRLTEPFFTTRLASGGTGLGLSISNLILRRHHGSIHFDSVPRQGTKATIRLPAFQAVPMEA